MSRPQLSGEYGISQRYLELAPARGEGPPFIRIGWSVRYRPEDVEAWLDTMVVDPTENGR